MTLGKTKRYGGFILFLVTFHSFLSVNGTGSRISSLPVLDHSTGWLVGISRRAITPETDVWLAGFGVKRPATGKLHDVWVKVLALKTKTGKSAVMVTTDHQGMSRTIYESLFQSLNQRFKLSRSEFMLTFSHNHSGPCLHADLVDYYPSNDEQQKRVAAYSNWMKEQIIDAVAEAFNNLQPAQIFKGEGKASFAVNRRENIESEVPANRLAGLALKGAVDHSVPVLSVRNPNGTLLAILFGYACHPTTLSGTLWSGDYPGFAQINLEKKYPSATAMFFNTCGGDQNPLPRGTQSLCEKYGAQLSEAVETVINKPMQLVTAKLQTAFQFVPLTYEATVTAEKLAPIATGNNEIRARWARRMLLMMDKGVTFPDAYPFYPVQAWQLGKELLLIGTGGETVVDYSLRFKREFGAGSTWVAGYTNILVAYIPSRRVWQEGGYEGGAHLDEYGHPAWRWAGDVEDRIAKGVQQLVQQVRK